MLRVLVLEDDPFIAWDLQSILESDGHQVIGACGSVSEARTLAAAIEYALLDIDVADGKSFGFAEELRRREIPFAFVSASQPAEVPSSLGGAAFIPKPYDEGMILSSVTAAMAAQ